MVIADKLTLHGKAKGVWIVPHHELLEWLRTQRNRTVPFERLAKFAERN